MLLSLEALESRAARTGLAGIPTKVRAGERLSPDEALAMYHTPDVTLLGALANEVRNARHGDTTYSAIEHVFGFLAAGASGAAAAANAQLSMPP